MRERVIFTHLGDLKHVKVGGLHLLSIHRHVKSVPECEHNGDPSSVKTGVGLLGGPYCYFG